MDKNVIKNVIIGLICLIILVFPNITTALNKYVYLSDIDYIEDKTFVGWSSISLDKNLQSNVNGGLINLLISGNKTNILKGITAHATSNIVYDISSYDYDYFTSYIGVDSSMEDRGDGVKFYIYTSLDGENWELKTSDNPNIMKGNNDAEFIKIDISGAKYLKLVCDKVGNNTSDHCVYGNAKLIKSDYIETNTPLTFIKTVEEYDAIIKQEGFNVNDNELILLQRDFVNNVGYSMLQSIASLSDEYVETLKWLVTDKENLKMYIMGGEPDGNYYDSIKVLSQLYMKYKDDFEITDVTSHGTVLGDLYKKMAITLSLTHSTQVSLWMQPNAIENQSDAVTRYQIYKDLHKNGKFIVSDNLDYTSLFEDLKIEEMRFVLNNIIDDEEILWLNEYTQSYIDAHPNEEEKYLQPHPYMKYIWPDYDKIEYHDETKKYEWSQKYGNFLDYGVTFKPGVYKLWMNLDNGAVCGGISKIGSNIRAVHGIPSSVISQPGHAAIIFYRKDSQGRGYWTIDNDVSGWAKSGRTERLSIRMPLGWGDGDYLDYDEDWLGLANYVLLAQGALNDFNNYQISKENMILASVYENDITQQMYYYRKAIEYTPINIDAWWGIINLYKNNINTTDEMWLNLAEEIMDNLKYYPLPMYHLVRSIDEEISSNIYKYKYTLLLNETLNEAKNATDNDTIQKQAVRQVAEYLLGIIDSELPTFSFDGLDSNKIVLPSRYDGTGIRINYSIDGKQTWKTISFTSDEEHKYLLTNNEISQITAENDIYIHIEGLPYTDENIYKIDISSQEKPNLYANDLENKIMGTNELSQWRYSESDEWIYFNEKSPDLTGDKTIQIRYASYKTTIASDIQILNFTKNNDTETKKYVSINHLSIDSVSTEALGNYYNGDAKNSIDGDYNTRWHSNWSGTDEERYIVIKLDKSIAISALDYVPAGGGNGKILQGTILGSLDGINYTELAKVNWLNDETIKTVEFSNKMEVMYIKIVGDKTSSAGSGKFIAARMFNIYEDTTKDLTPTIDLEYSISSTTNKDVVVKVINNSNIIITNNDGKDYYTFTENGEFTFEFKNTLTNKTGSAKAVVTWIDKIAPYAEIKYSITSNTYENVVATLVNENEPITIISGSISHTFTENGEYEFIFQDKAGNISSLIAKVDWILTEEVIPDTPTDDDKQDDDKTNDNNQNTNTPTDDVKQDDDKTNDNNQNTNIPTDDVKQDDDKTNDNNQNTNIPTDDDKQDDDKTNDNNQNTNISTDDDKQDDDKTNDNKVFIVIIVCSITCISAVFIIFKKINKK